VRTPPSPPPSPPSPLTPHPHSSPHTLCGTQFVQGQTILDYYGFTGISMWGWLAIEACFFVGEAADCVSVCVGGGWVGGGWGAVVLLCCYAPFPHFIEARNCQNLGGLAPPAAAPAPGVAQHVGMSPCVGTVWTA
jgi:hypothetical protein